LNLKAEIKKAFDLNSELEKQKKAAENENLDLNFNKNNLNKNIGIYIKSISQLKDDIQSLEKEKLGNSLLQSQKVRGLIIFLNIFIDCI
jgi:hypothetical protein